MHGLMMDFPLTLSTSFRRAETLFPEREIVSRQPDKTVRRYRYRDFGDRARRLVHLVQDLGVRAGDRVATLAWSHSQHLEAYFAAPLAGAVLHTLSLRLHPDELAYVINHAEDRVLIVDASLVYLFASIRNRVNVATVIVIGEAGPLEGALDYESAIAGAAPIEDLPEVEERSAAVMCYTTGTTGRAKGVVYSHRSLVLHSLGICLPDVLSIGERDVVLPAVPMFHANGWGFPFACAMVGAKLVMPGPHLDPASVLELLKPNPFPYGGAL